MGDMTIDKSSYEWLFFKRRPHRLRAGPFQMGFEKNLITEEEDSCPGFSDRLRKLMLQIIQQSNDVAELRKVLSFLAFVGTEEDIPLIEDFHKLENEDLSTDIKTCVFEIQHR